MSFQLRESLIEFKNGDYGLAIHLGHCRRGKQGKLLGKNRFFSCFLRACARAERISANRERNEIIAHAIRGNCLTWLNLKKNKSQEFQTLCEISDLILIDLSGTRWYRQKKMIIFNWVLHRERNWRNSWIFSRMRSLKVLNINSECTHAPTLQWGNRAFVIWSMCRESFDTNRQIVRNASKSRASFFIYPHTMHCASFWFASDCRLTSVVLKLVHLLASLFIHSNLLFGCLVVCFCFSADEIARLTNLGSCRAACWLLWVCFHPSWVMQGDSFKQH